MTGRGYESDWLLVDEAAALRAEQHPVPLTPEDLYAAVVALDWSALPEPHHPGPGPTLPDRLVRDGRGQVIARLRRDPYDPAPA